MHENGCKSVSNDLLAYLDQSLSPSRREEVACHLAACVACREELAWYESFARQLERHGAQTTAHLPRVDVRAQVFAAIKPAPARAAEPKFLAFRPRRETARFWIGFATAAVLAAGLWAAAVLLPGARHAPQVAYAPERAPSLATPDPASGLDQGHRDRFDAERRALGDLRVGMARSSDAFEETGAPEIDAAVSVEDVIQARRDAQTLPDALQRLSEWARLSLADAQKLAGHADATLAQQVAASEVLPLDEAIAVLEQAVMDYPDDLTARFALAKAYSEREGMEQQALDAWVALARLDPGNSTPYMEMAALMFARGDVEQARALLQHAATLERADVYAGNAAQYRRDALVAAGMAEDTASLVAAFAAGSGEHDYLSDLGRTLLAQADYHLAQGDTETAVTVYEALLQFGRQIEDGADFSLPQLAGLDLQRAAAEALELLYVALGEAEPLQELTQHALLLVASIDQIAVFFESLNALFRSDIDPALWILMADFVLGNGDLAVFDFFSGLF